jgi:hypothetical protein
MGQIPHEGIVMVKRQATPRMRAIWGGMWPYAIENKVGTTKGIHLLNFQGENNLEGVQKPSSNDHLAINVAYVRTSVWRN